MPIFLDPRGHTNFGIAICDRCHFKRFSDELVPDPNYPGLRVCDPGAVRPGCKDQFDPWRLPARQTENITLRFVRPDVPIDGVNPNLPVQQILSQRLVDANGEAILDSNGNYIDVTLQPPPDQVPL